MIPVNKTYLPPREEYERHMARVWENGWVTNNGALLQELETQLEDFLDVRHVRVVANGTVALQLAIRLLDLEGEVITTPFSYVATTGALLWERCQPVFADVDPDTFNLDPARAEAVVTPRTSALLPTHVYGAACDVEDLQAVADRHGLRILYDGAHAFGSTFAGRSLLQYGNLTALSFHATKLFHTVEGGALITDDPDLVEQIELMRAFGHRGDHHACVGINAKASEMHAAMGLCLLPRMDDFIAHRRELHALYRERLAALPLQFQRVPEACGYNYAYFPVVFPSHKSMMVVKEHLAERDIYTRRYFSPALNRLPYVEAARCPVAERLAKCVLCLPFFQEITPAQVEQVAAAVGNAWPTARA